MNLRKTQKVKLIGLCDGLEIRIWKREVSKLILLFLSWSYSGMGNTEKWSDLREGSVLVSFVWHAECKVHLRHTRGEAVVCGSPEL